MWGDAASERHALMQLFEFTSCQYFLMELDRVRWAPTDDSVEAVAA